MGHRGAAALAPENTLEALRCAVEAGVDLVEVDVRGLADGTLVLAHSDDLADLTRGRGRGRVSSTSLAELRAVAPDVPTLREALAFLAATAPHVGAQVDLKQGGILEGVVNELRRVDAVERALVSCCEGAWLCELAELEPELTRALTYPCSRFRLGGASLAAARFLGLRPGRRALPRRIARLLGRAQATVAALHWSVVSRAAVEEAHRVGAAVLAWTVNDRAVAERLVEVGVDGLITDDPAALEATLRP